MPTDFSVVSVVLVLLIIALIFWYLSESKPSVVQKKPEHLLSYLQYQSIVLPIYYHDGLYWAEIILENQLTGNSPQSYHLLVDTASDLILVPDISCTDCKGPRWIIQSNGPTHRIRFQGGQDVRYQYATAYSPTLRQNLQIGVMVNGSDNPHDDTLNVFGLMNPALQLHYLQLNFRENQLSFHAQLSKENLLTTWSQLFKIPYWAIPATGIPGIDWIILDTGTEYVIADPSTQMPNGFEFTVGQTVVSVNSKLMRYKSALVPKSVIIGNLVMRQYNWIFDFISLRVAIV